MKDNRTFTLIAVVIVGLLIGLAVVSKQNQSPFFKVIYDQQIALLKGQNQIADSLDKVENSGIEVQEIMAKFNDLEERFVKLEALVKAGNRPANAPTRAQRPAEDFDKVYDIPVDHTPVIGNKDASVTMVEFIDLQCPYCSRFHEAFVAAAKAFPGKVNYMIKNYPLQFHPHARNAAKAAFAAGEQGKYIEMVDLLLENQKQLGKEKYVELAGKLGLNIDKFKQDLIQNDKKYDDLIEKDIAVGNSAHVRGTPTMFINGRKTRARTLDAYKKEIEEILKK